MKQSNPQARRGGQGGPLSQGRNSYTGSYQSCKLSRERIASGLTRPEVIVWLGETRKVDRLSWVVLVRSDGALCCWPLQEIVSVGPGEQTRRNRSRKVPLVVDCDGVGGGYGTTSKGVEGV